MKTPWTDKERVLRDDFQKVWDAVAVEVHSRIESAAFGISFPLTCDDAPITIGCNASAFWKVADGHLPDWHQTECEPPPTLAILDFLEFCYERVAEPIQIGYHDFFRHYHLRFDREQGREKFLIDVNLILARNGLALRIRVDGANQKNSAGRNPRGGKKRRSLPAIRNSILFSSAPSSST